MVKLKNYNVVLKHFVLLLTFTSLISCAEKKYTVTRIEGKQIAITAQNSEQTQIENFIKPYRDRIDKDLSLVLSNAPETIDKSGEWQTPMGNFLSDITFDKSNVIFQLREKKSIDICLLNHGGIRTIISKGDVTARNAYEIMPFENSAIVVGLKEEQIMEMIDYLIAEKKPHPLKGLTFTIDKDKPKINEATLKILQASLEKRYIEFSTIDDQPFRSSYTYLKDTKFKPLGILNLPYEEDRAFYNKEVQNFLIRFGQVYAFMFLISIVLSYFLSSYITKSLKIISDKMQETQLDQRNEKIVIEDGSEEINLLIKFFARTLCIRNLDLTSLVKEQDDNF
jgi:preprotein translocase subunit SecG